MIALAVGLAIVALGLPSAGGDGPTGRSQPFAAKPDGAGDRPIAALKRALRTRRSVSRRVSVTLGHSLEGRPITATAVNGIGGVRGGPVVLAIGCIHGDECAGVGAVERALGSPPLGDGLVVVRSLNPDGLNHATRLNARGVDLNRNFAAGWRPIGVPGDPEHSGPRPFSEPESGIARRLITRLRPDVTIWFHQQEQRLVRAWGPSIPAARAYARLADEPFRRMPWLPGTAPNWQNHRFPGTSSFVVELPLDGPAHTKRHGQAIWQLANEL